jgi:hypothetical protein
MKNRQSMRNWHKICIEEASTQNNKYAATENVVQIKAL